jgi:effector-binding domain-containing protein
MLKGRKFLFILLLGLCSMLVLISVSIPIDFTTRVQVPFALDKTLQLFTDPQQQQKWFASTPDRQLIINKAIPGDILLTLAIDDDQQDYDLRVTRESPAQQTSSISLTLTKTLWKRFIEYDPLDAALIRSLHNLESVTNNTEKFYGFPIRQVQSADSLFLYASTVIDPGHPTEGARLLFDTLLQFAKAQGLAVSNRKIFSSQLLSNTELRIFAGIAIAVPITIPATAGITLKQMSAGKKVLLLDYKGPYNKIASAYKALEQYKKDNQLANLDIPYEVWEDEAPEHQDDPVHLNIYNPVY